ncbi:MAG: hypothetical protein RSE13_00030 [Planktothrix sp. GU0601_MAG3]|nr:MAG: hypothetical protein RSE13_00030 [Planktothrix sp. GU0601_MAG3]
MAYLHLRLTSTSHNQYFVIMPHSLVGYCEDGTLGSITLYTPSYAVNLERDNWDNWDEFVAQVKTNFVEQEDF